jgi:hypothetical protein
MATRESYARVEGSNYAQPIPHEIEDVTAAALGTQAVKDTSATMPFLMVCISQSPSSVGTYEDAGPTLPASVGAMASGVNM